MNNNQIGLVMLYCNLPSVRNCIFSGLKYGLVCNTTYFASIENCHFELCETGLCTIGFNANLIENLVGFYCKLLANISGSQIVVNNFNAESCESALQFNGSNIVMNGVYCENTDLKKENSFQLIFGNKSANNVLINGLTLTANNRRLILLDVGMKDIYINSGKINGPIVSKDPGNSLVAKNLLGSFTIQGPGKFRRE